MEHPRKPFAEMSLNEARAWIQQTREHLQQKIQREQAYLERRAVQGIRTSTDEAYENDLMLETDLLLLLDELEQNVSNGF